MVTGAALVSLLVYLVVVGLVFWLLWWGLSVLPIPEPFNRVLRVLLVLFSVLILVNLLLGLIGHPFVRW